MIVLRRRLAVALLALVGCALLPAPGAAALPGDPTAVSDVFTGTVAHATPVPGVGKLPDTYVYAIDVDVVYKGDVSTARVEVRTSSSFEKCKQAELDTTTTYIFALGTQGGSLVAAECNDARASSEELLQTLQDRFGAGRPPVGTSQEPKPDPFPAVQYRSGGVSDPAQFDRSAAPGLALVIVGILGLFVVRRMARPRH